MQVAATAQRTAAMVLCVQCWLVALGVRDERSCWLHVKWYLSFRKQVPVRLKVHSCGAQHARLYSSLACVPKSSAFRATLLRALVSVTGRLWVHETSIKAHAPRGAQGRGRAGRHPPTPSPHITKGHIPYAQHSSSLTKRSELLEGTFLTPFRLNFLPVDRGGDGGITKPPSVPQDCVRRTDDSMRSSAASLLRAS